MTRARNEFEAAVIKRMKESGFLEIEIRVECLVRSDEGYQDGAVDDYWHFWQEARASNALPDGYVLVPKSMSLDADSLEALVFAGGGPDGDNDEATYLDCVMWVGGLSDDEGKITHGLHAYCTECEEEGSTTLAEFAPVNMAEGGAEMTRAERIITALEARIVELERQRDVLINGQVDASSGWLRAIDTALVVSHLGIVEPGDTHEQASTKLAALIDWHVAVATDPAVNGGLRLVPVDHVEHARPAAPTALCTACNQIKPLTEYAKALPEYPTRSGHVYTCMTCNAARAARITNEKLARNAL